MIGNFNIEAQKILKNARDEMIKLGHPYIGTEHLLLAILKSDTDLANKLNEYGLTYDNFKDELCKVVGKTNKKSEYFLYTPLLRKIIENAIIDSKENNNGEVTEEHLFYAMLDEGEGIAIRLLIGMNIDIESMYDNFSSSLIKKSNHSNKRKLLITELGFDMTSKVNDGTFDPVIGRDKEVKRVMEILCRRTKNNPILIGEAGVGKTAIVEELARRIVLEDVPNNLIGKRIIALDMATMVAGTKYRGEFEERMKKIVKEVEDNDNIILFIDEIHTLVGAGGAEGAIDASNILKPALARGNIHCIGATTTNEYKNFIEHDSALERRFQKVIINEPSREETLNIISKLKPIYEKYHNVIVSDEVIKNIVDLSEKYIFDRNRPDKEIDILDEVCSMVSMRISKDKEKENNLRKTLLLLEKEKNSYIIDKHIDKAYDIRKKETKLMSSLNELELKSNDNKGVITVKDVAYVINSRSNVPVYEVMDNPSQSINKLKSDIKKLIIGQDNAVDSLLDMTKRIKFGCNNRVYSSIFIGPSGVGKSALAKIFGCFLVGEDRFIRLDLSEYSDSSSVNKILGSSPGYVGYDDNNNILEEVRNNPNCVILLDEIDKAHPLVLNLLYQILDEGKIKNSKGTVVRFDNAIIIMTTNGNYETNSIGFSKSSDGRISEVKNILGNALVNRIDDIIFFNRLKEDDVREIINNRLNNLKNSYSNINISFTDNLVNNIILECKFEQFGARRVEKIIQSKVIPKIIDALIEKKKNVLIDTIINKENITI